MSEFYEELCNMFIRPARQKYNIHDLGNPIVNKIGKRRDFQIITHHNLKLKCSYYENLLCSKGPCIIYLHSFNGSRLQPLRYIERLLEKFYNICTFDFSGSGNSEGQYVSLGFHQRYDIMNVMKYLVKTYDHKKFVLWGRSMGASSIIKFMEYYSICQQQSILKNVVINSIVLDSPFCSLSRLSIEIAQKKVSIPEIFLKAVFVVIKSTIERKAEFKVSQLQLLDYLDTIKCPVLILASQDDQLTSYQHSQQIYSKLTTSKKQLIFIKGQHYQNRESQTIDKIINFISKQQKITQKKLVSKSHSKNKYSELSVKKQYPENQLNQSYIHQNTYNISFENKQSPILNNTSNNIIPNNNYEKINTPKSNNAKHFQNFKNNPMTTMHKQYQHEVYRFEKSQLKSSTIQGNFHHQPHNKLQMRMILTENDSKGQQNYVNAKFGPKKYEKPATKLIKLTQQQESKNQTQRSNKNQQYQQHMNIINSKLKRRKKQDGEHQPKFQYQQPQKRVVDNSSYINPGYYFNSPMVTARKTSEHQTKFHNNKSLSHNKNTTQFHAFNQTIERKVSQNMTQIKQIQQQSSQEDRKKVQRINTVANFEDKLPGKKMIHGSISLKYLNFDRERQNSKRRNQNELKVSKKCLLFASMVKPEQKNT